MTAMTFQDIFKSGFLERTSTISITDMALAMFLAFVTGLFIFYIYKLCYCGVMYSAVFGMTLVGLTLVTTLVMLAVTSNVVLSLGMVGALSIVRFRTAIKEPSDIVFLFWSIGAGIVLAAGLLFLAVFGSVFIGLALLLISGRKNRDRPYILVVHCDNEQSERQVCELTRGRVRAFVLKSKSVMPNCIELNYELRLREEDCSFVNELASMEGVSHTVLVSYNGDYMG